MILEATSYPNRIRTISGVVNFVFPDDSIILCNTSTGAVAIELAEIPSNSWNTIYKVYIKDASTNATTNNITINAPVGYTINGNPSLVINQDDGVVLIRIASNTEYLGDTNFGSSSGIAVLDQGVLLTPSCSSMDFVGSNITATNIGNAVTVSVTNNFVTLTFAQLTNLINTNTVVTNQAYLVTDAIFGSSPAILTSIVVVGITNNRVSEQGQGIFYNADYQLVGNYSGVSGFVANLGLWSAALLPVLGDVVIWNNFHYVNITGLNGLVNPSADLVNWQFLSYSTTKGYILEVDTISYDQFSNQIMNRTDIRKNVVDRGVQGGFNSFNGFPWGNSKVFDNKILGNSCAKVMNCNIGDEFSENEIFNSSLIIGDTNIQGQCSFFKGNRYSNSNSHFITKASNFQYNIINTSNFDSQNNEGNILNNQIHYCLISLTNNLGDFIFNDLDHTGLDIISSSLGSAFSNNRGKENSILISTNNLNIIDNSFYNSNITIGTNQNRIARNKFNDSTIIITTNNATGDISENTFDYSRFEVALNNGNITTVAKSGGNNFVNSALLIGTNNSDISGNYFINSSSIVLETVNAEFYNNIGNNTRVSIRFFQNAMGLTNTYLGNFFEGTLLQNVIGGIYYPSFSIQGTIPYELDMSQPSIYDPATFTLIIPVEVRDFCSSFTLSNGAGLTINKIIQGNQNINSIFRQSSGAGVVTFNSVLVAGALPDEITSPNGAFAYNVALGDQIILSLGVINKVISSSIIL